MFSFSDNPKKYVFLGGAGSGKSETAINAAVQLARMGKNEVHFFDMDMTKPLFRSRDVCELLRKEGIVVHFQEQFMDTPVIVGGADHILRRNDVCAVFDIGGDDIGARALGALAPAIRNHNVECCYLINPYRPWSDTLEGIDGVLSSILRASRLSLDQLSFAANPNLGPDTTVDEILNGLAVLNSELAQTVDIRFVCVSESLADQVVNRIEQPVFPLKLYLSYEWNEQ